MNRAVKVSIASCFIVALTYILMREADRVRTCYSPAPALTNELCELGQEALTTGDVPVGAVLLLDDSIIGRGANTVHRDANPAGHAEVNAVQDAMRVLGQDRFNRLDKDRLLLLSTFEPCGMCTGMMLEYGISRVAYIEPKDLWHHLRQDLRWMRFLLLRQRSHPFGLQDSLFRLHPSYDPERMDH